jgi:hypothetical protein
MGLLLGLALTYAPAPAGPLSDAKALVGEGTYYAKGLMQKVEDRRAGWGHVTRCRECVGSVALLECRHIGRRVWVERLGPGKGAGEVVGPLLVVDCAGREDAAALRRRGWVADLAFELGAQRWRMNGPSWTRRVRVHFERPGPMPGRVHRKLLTASRVAARSAPRRGLQAI